MVQVFGVTGAKSQLLTETRYGTKPQEPWLPFDTVNDYVPKYALDSLPVQEDLRYGNPEVDGYSLCDVNPSDDNEYYDPKLMQAKLKSTLTPLILSTSDEIEFVGATKECVAKDTVCNTANTRPINTDPVEDIIRGTDNPLPGPFSGRYKKCVES
jgi:hypothetical protein